MKNLIYIFLIISMHFKISANEINELESQGRNLEAMKIALSGYQELSAQIQFDDFVKSIKNKVTQVHKEVVTDTTYVQSKWNTKSFSVGVMALFTTNKGQSSSKTNQTAWINENSADFNNASLQVERDLLQLKNDVKNYALANKETLLLLKKLTAKAMQLSSKLNDEEFLAWHSELESMYTSANYFQFSGQQIVLRCEVKKHATVSSYSNYSNDYDTTSASDVAYSRSSGNVETNKQNKRKGYKEEECKTEYKQTTVSAEAVLEHDFKEVNVLLDGWYKSISARYLLKKQAPEAYYWGVLN